MIGVNVKMRNSGLELRVVLRFRAHRCSLSRLAKRPTVERACSFDGLEPNAALPFWKGP